jgi:hypothetical protein
MKAVADGAIGKTPHLQPVHMADEFGDLEIGRMQHYIVARAGLQDAPASA